MKSKTCGECKNYIAMNRCVLHNQFVQDDDFCGGYIPKTQPITNGDVIRQGGNRELAEYFVYETGAMLASTLIVDKTFDTYEEAIEATEEYLNAPADCVKQNGNHETQSDLCKVDNTGSEAKDE